MKPLSIVLLLLSDAVGMALALRLTYLIRIKSGLFTNPLPVELSGPLTLLALFWWFMFGMRSMYRTPVVISRFDEVINTLKTIVFGTIILFFATFDVSHPLNLSRLFLITYGMFGFLFTFTGRVLIRNWQRWLRSRRKALWKAIIVGFNDIGFSLNHQLLHWPVWGFDVIGFVDADKTEGDNLGKKILGNINDLPEIITKHQITWVLIAPQKYVQDSLIHVLDICSFQRVRFMLVASYYQMLAGLVRTVEIHGLPLVEVMPRLVSQTTLFFKRTLDIVISILALPVFTLIFPFIAIAILIDSPGRIFYMQRRVGKRGIIFKVLKFRSMITNAEAVSGAVWATKDDPRITKVGKFLRKSYIDELPQLFNVLFGHMSIVGPRPERPHFVEQFKGKIPLYERRLRVRPGITGWAQVRHKYDETIDDVREKTRYDLFYIDHISLTLDLRIILLTTLKILKGKGH